MKGMRFPADYRLRVGKTCKGFSELMHRGKQIRCERIAVGKFQVEPEVNRHRWRLAPESPEK